MTEPKVTPARRCNPLHQAEVDAKIAALTSEVEALTRQVETLTRDNRQLTEQQHTLESAVRRTGWEDIL